MNRLYTLVIAILITTSSLMAQNFNYSTVKDTVATIINDQYEIYDIYISTTVPEAITYKFYLVSNTFPATWGTSLCDYVNCYIGIPAGVNTMTAITLAEAQTGVQAFFKLTVNVLNNYGTGVVKIYVYDANDINRGDTISWTITHLQPNGITDHYIDDELLVYPNPAKNNVNFTNNSGSDMIVDIFNSLGKLVITNLILTNQSSKLDVRNLNAGIYFISFNDINGDRKTKKLIIQ